jgi:hypothetical protein
MTGHRVAARGRDRSQKRFGELPVKGGRLAAFIKRFFVFSGRGIG